MVVLCLSFVRCCSRTDSLHNTPETEGKRSPVGYIDQIFLVRPGTPAVVSANAHQENDAKANRHQNRVIFLIGFASLKTWGQTYCSKQGIPYKESQK